MTDSPNLAPLLDRVFGAASPELVFGAPVEANGYTVITASEVMAGGGFGLGSGTGPTLDGVDSPNSGSGSGGGGGGGSASRPVAVIVIGPNGVSVKPVFDTTKLGLAALTAWAAVALAAFKLQRKARG
jgi:uncharacterized spore protein YtfJ